MELDVRSFCVALVADELINEGAAGFDLLGLLDRTGWGVIALPPGWYPEAVAGPLLAEVADHVYEFSRNGYAIALIGQRAGLEAALARVGIAAPEPIDPCHPVPLEAALAAAAADRAPHDAAAGQRAPSDQ